MTTLQHVELGVLGPLQVRQHGLPVAVPGAKPRAILTMLGLHGSSVVSADTLAELLWGARPPRTAAKALQTHISSLRRALGDGFVLTEGTGWTLSTTEIDATRYKLAARLGRDAVAAGDAGQAVARFEEALSLWRGIPELPDGPRAVSEKTRWLEGHAALVEDRADALLATGRAAEIVGELEAAIADAPLRERRWGQLMLALYRAGRQGEALGAYQRARSLLADELGVDPGPNLRRLEAAIVTQDTALEVPVSQQLSTVTRAVTFLLTDIEGSTAAWEAQADAMAVALARHDEIVEQVVTSRGGRLVKTRGEGDATFSVFDRPSAAAAAAIELQEAIFHEPWILTEPMRIRVALHTGEVELRDGDYFGRAVNRAARLRSLAAGGQILCSGATAELVIDTLSDDVILADLGKRQLKNLARPEHVFELRLETADDSRPLTVDAPMERPALPAVLGSPGPFVGRGRELERLVSAWQATLAAGTHAVLIAGEPGVGKTRLAGEWSRRAYDDGAVVLYGRCDEDLGAPYQPFAEALRSLVPGLGTNRLRGLRGIEALVALVPGLTDALLDLPTPSRSDPDTERYALFDAVVALLGVASANAPVILILDDLHWAAKPTLLLLRHLLRFGEHARVQIVGTYRSTDLDRSHPLAAMLADLHRDGSADRLTLGGLDESDVSAYVAEAGYDDEELGRALASVTGGNPFFLIEALRHVDESGGRWDPSTLPQGIREAVSRRLSRLPAETNKALAAAAVVGSRFGVELVERVVEQDLVDAFDEARKAGLLIEEPGGSYRFNHALVRQSLLTELASVRRMRLHQRIATALEAESGADDELLAELAYHYFECAWAGNATKAVEYCRRAADQAMARLAYEGAAELYDKALHALEELDDERPDRDDQKAELLIARCEALLAAGDVVTATGAVSQLQSAAGDSARLAAWGTCFDGELAMLTDPERLDEIASAVGAAAEKLAELDDAAGEAKAHTVRAGCVGRLGRIGDCETALDQALTAARQAREHRRVNAVLAGAPLAALWGPNPVPRAGGRCLDVVRLLRITTGSPVVEATSTRCQGVLDAFRGRAAAGRALIDSARRTLTELGMRHALLEVDQFAGIVELVADDPAAAEKHLRRAYKGFRRMGLDVDIADTAALLARACLALGRDAEAHELCIESERLAGHALKPSIAWRSVRAQLLARSGDHDEARRLAQEAVAVAERTDLLVDHGDACLALATVLGIAGDAAGARAAAEKAAELYELKGAAALFERAHSILGAKLPTAPAPPEAPVAELDNACVRAGECVTDAVNREAWDEFERLFAPDVFVESHRKIVGFAQIDLPSDDWPRQNRRVLETSGVWLKQAVIAMRGERLTLARLVVGTADLSPGAPHDEFLSLYGIDEEGRIALQVWFDLEDVDAAMAELDAAHARFEELRPRARRLENAASNAGERFLAYFAARDWDTMAEVLADDYSSDDRRRVVNAGLTGRDAVIESCRSAADLGFTHATADIIATRGGHLTLMRALYSGRDQGQEVYLTEILGVIEINTDDRISSHVVFGPDDLDAAFEELDARYLAGEAAAYSHMWSVIVRAYAAANKHELRDLAPGWVNIDHRRGRAFAPGDMTAYIYALWEQAPDVSVYIDAVHRLSNLGALVTHSAHGTSQEGFDAEWREIALLMFEGDLINRIELFDEADLDTALARFEQLTRPAPRLENTATQVDERFNAYLAARDWVAMAERMTDDVSIDDRRRVVGSGFRHGRDAEIANMRAIVDLGVKSVTSTVIATRGERLVLSRVRWSGPDKQAEASFHTDALGIVEINTDDRIVARVVFDLDDVDAAIAELDARYLAGEAAAHARTWSLIARTYAAVNRHQLPPTTPDHVSLDHHRAAFAPGDLFANLRAGWIQVPDATFRVEAVHRLSNLGAVVTHAASGTSREGFAAEWREIHLTTVEGDLFNRNEMFDEADLDAALARFEELQPHSPRLENAASQRAERLLAHFAAREWDVMADDLAAEYSQDDRRRVVNAGTLRGREAEIESFRSAADLGVTHFTSDVVATRGKRVSLMNFRAWGRDQGPEEFISENLFVVEINADNRITTAVVFDSANIDAAFEELDARYLAGEAAAHAHTWSVVAAAYAALNRHELPAATPDWVNIDHQQVTSIAPGELFAAVRATWELAPGLKPLVEAVHRLGDLGAVVTHVAHGTSHEGFDAEWRQIGLLTVDGDLINRIELFDEADIDAALARFDELRRPAPELENAASRTYARYRRHFAARDWAAMAELLTDDTAVQDHRRVVNDEARRGRDVEIANMRAVADIGARNVTSAVVATRGEHLALCRNAILGDDEQPGAFRIEFLCVVEINADEQIVARGVFDADDIEAAFDELDDRYLAGEAADHGHVWSVITRAYTALNRREIPATSRNWANIDHRRSTSFEPGDLPAYIRSLWDVASDVKVYVETVHRVSDFGALVSSVTRGRSIEGFDAEWREINLSTVDGELITRSELFDNADLDAALARFDELGRPMAQLENAASQVYGRFSSCYASGDLDGLATTMADDFAADDRRRLVGTGGTQLDRNAAVDNARVTGDLGVRNATSTVIAIRGQRLALMRARFWGRDELPDAFHTEVLHMVEIDASQQIATFIAFDLDDLDASFEELDARYLAGEAAPHAHTYSVIAGAFAAVNRHELPSTTSDLVSIDHRRPVAFAPGELIPYLQATLNDSPEIRIDIHAVHRLSSLGAVVTHAWHNTSQQGFDAEWRVIGISTVDGDLINRCELFDESDLDAALATFEELSRPAPRLENTASEVAERFWKYFAARDWEAMSANLADDIYADDRRRVENAGIRRGRESASEDLRATADVGFTNLTSAVIATRGEHVTLTRLRASGSDPEAIQIEVLHIIEIDADGRIAAIVVFDLDDIDAAFEELDARYVAGEAAAHSRTWSVIAGGCAAFNRHEIPPATPDWVTIDHRPGASFEPGDLTAYIRSTWDVTPDSRVYPETVHRLGELGAVVTLVSKGTTQQGFEAEWRQGILLTVYGDLINRCELFEEADLDAALARFDELSRPAPPLENAATDAFERLQACFAVRDWNAMTEILTEHMSAVDHRRVVNSGTRHGNAAAIASMQAAVGLGAESISSTAVATRGGLLVLLRSRYSGGDRTPGAFHSEDLCVVEVDAGGRIAAHVTFDLDDLDAAFAELDARYMAGEAAAHAHTWSLISRAYAALNRHELPATTPDWVNVDHRHGTAFDQGGYFEFVRAAWDVAPNMHRSIEAVHRLSNLGAVVTHAAHGTSQGGFEAEWRSLVLVTVDGDLFNHLELFDEADLDAALARFIELNRPPGQLDNAASRAAKRFACFGARDWDALAEDFASDFTQDDRRRVVGAGVRHGRDAEIEDLRAFTDLGLTNVTFTILATRGERLALSRSSVWGGDPRSDGVHTDMLTITEVDADGRIASLIIFDPDDIDAAIEELDARYVIGEAAAHADTWSAIAHANETFNRREMPPTTPDWVNVDHRRGGMAFAPGDQTAYMRATWDVAPHISNRIVAVHRLGDLGAAFTQLVQATSREGFDAEWRDIVILTVDGDAINRCEVFDEADLDAAIAMFDELNVSAPHLENAATRLNTPIAEAFNHRDLEGYLGVLTADARYDDRRKGLRNAGPMNAEFGHSLLFASAESWRLEIEPIAIRGQHLAVSRYAFRDADEADRPIAVEALVLTAVTDDQLVEHTVLFDPGDINGATAELTARWIASGEVAHPEVIERELSLVEAANRHDWDAFAEISANATYFNHRQLAAGGVNTIAGHMSSIQAMASLVPDMWLELADVLAHSAAAVITHLIVKGMSTDSVVMELPLVMLNLHDGSQITHMETFDFDQRDLALARFQELNG